MRRQWLWVTGLALVASACSGSQAPRAVSAGRAPDSYEVHGFGVNLSDADLTARAPLVIEGQVATEETLALRDDPYLPAGWESDPETADMVNSGFRHTVWTVNVQLWLKGTSATTIRAVRAASGGEYGLDAAAPPGGVLPKPGSKYRMWLEPDPWFQQNHYILVRAVQV